MDKQKVKITLNKIQNYRAEQGTKFFFKKIIQFLVKKIVVASNKKVLRKRESLFQNIYSQKLVHDIEDIFSHGLLRPLNEIKADVRLLDDEFSNDFIAEADRILENQFLIYGALRVRLKSDRFLWRKDPLAGFLWPEKLTYTYFVKQKPHGIDIKNIWEIARFQFLAPLSYAYIFTNDERYVYFAIDKIKSWIEENPFLNGPHWTMPMESSIRLTNWCVHLPLLDIFNYTDANFKNMIARSMLEHLIYIKENLEISLSKEGNHYLSNLVGLLLAQLLFPSLKWANECTAFAVGEYENQIDKQFSESGLYFEGSIAYHRLGSEMLLIGIALLKKNGEKLKPKLIERLRQVIYFTEFYTNICDENPIIGDNDSGVFIRLFPRQELSDHRYIKTLSGAILKNESKPINLNEFLSSVHFIPTEMPVIKEDIERNSDDSSRLQVHEFDGLIIASNKSEAIFFNTLHSSQRHSHNDKLSIYPVVGKNLFFLDRGSFSYSGFPDKRQQDRMSSSHNGPVVNNWEQSNIWKEDLYYINGEAKCFNSVIKKDSILKITGNHIGYERFRKGLKTYRKIEWNVKERIILIEDWLEGKPTQETFQLSWHFLINPIWTSSFSDNGFVFTCQDQKVCFEDFESVGFKIVQSHYCPAYQIEKNCEALHASSKIGIGEIIRFRLRY